MKKKITPFAVVLAVILLGVIVYFAATISLVHPGRIKEDISVRYNKAETDNTKPADTWNIIATQSAKASSGETNAGSISSIPVMQKIIRNGEIELKVDSIVKTVEKIKEISKKQGGYIGNSVIESPDYDQKTGTVVVRVPREAFDRTVAALKKLGQVNRESVTSEDVTEEYVDIESRLKNLKREEEQFLEVLKVAKKVNDILSVETELSRVRGEIETATGRMKYLDNRIALSTITISLYEKRSVTETAPKLWSITETAKNAFRSLLGTFKALISVAIWIAVYLPIIIIVILLIVIFRRIRAKKTKKGDS